MLVAKCQDQSVIPPKQGHIPFNILAGNYKNPLLAKLAAHVWRDLLFYPNAC
jgi:hypothetical protein